MSADPPLSDPLTPADSDLADYRWAPVDINRMLTSETWVLGTPEEKVAAFTLWMRSWQQKPAASLPSDDRMLAYLSDAGAAWPTVRDHALRGWVRCNDGRLYHPVMAEKVREALEQKRAQKSRTEAARRARHSKSQGSDKTSSDSATGHVTLSMTENATECATDAVADDVTRSTRQYSTRPKEEAKQYRPDVHPARGPTMPCRSDGPEAWAPLVTKWEVDGSGVKRPVVAGEYVDLFADRVLEAAKINDVNWRGDWGPMLAWLRDGCDPEQIIRVIRGVAARPSYRPPAKSLNYFNDAVREGKAAP